MARPLIILFTLFIVLTTISWFWYALSSYYHVASTHVNIPGSNSGSYKQVSTNDIGSEGNSVSQGITRNSIAKIKWSKIIKGRLAIYINNKLAEIIDPDPFTKNIELFFSNLAFLSSDSAPSSTYPITLSGTPVSIAPRKGSYSSSYQHYMVRGVGVRFYLSNESVPNDIWNTFSIPSYLLSGQQQYNEVYFTSTDAIVKISTLILSNVNATIRSIYITAKIAKYNPSSYSNSYYEYLLAVEPVNLTIKEGDNITITWSLDIKLAINTGSSTIYIRNLVGLVIGMITGTYSVIDTSGNTRTGSYIGVDWSIPNLCVSDESFTSFSSSVNGYCKYARTYYSSIQELAIMYTVYYPEELSISSIKTLYSIGELYSGNPSTSPLPKFNIILVEVTGVNEQVSSREVVASINYPVS